MFVCFFAPPSLLYFTIYLIAFYTYNNTITSKYWVVHCFGSYISPLKYVHRYHHLLALDSIAIKLLCLRLNSVSAVGCGVFTSANACSGGIPGVGSKAGYRITRTGVGSKTGYKITRTGVDSKACCRVTSTGVGSKAGCRVTRTGVGSKAGYRITRTGVDSKACY